MAPDPQWERPEVDEPWIAWGVEPGMHGIWKRLRADDTWNAWYRMHGIWNAGCEAPRMNGNV